MTRETKFLGIILIVSLALLFGGIFLLSRGESGGETLESGAVSQIDYSKGQKIGSDSAKVKLVEFSDLQCPACAAAELVLKNLRTTYPNKIQFIYRHFPLPQHSYGRKVASLAEAAGEEGKFWEMHDKLFEMQSEWSGLPDATSFFLKLVKDLNLDEDKVKQALEKDIFKSKIDDSIAEGQRLGVTSTPTFFLNGRKLNLTTFDDLTKAVEEELKK